MKHTNNLGQRLTNIKVAILKTMIDTLDEPINMKKFKIKHRDLYDELIRLEKLLEEKNNMEHNYQEEVKKSFKKFLFSFKQLNKSFTGVDLMNDRNEINMYLQTLMMSLMSTYRELAVLEHDNFVNCLKEVKVDLLEKENGRS